MPNIVILEHNVLSAQYMFSIQVDIITRFKRVGRVRVSDKSDRVERSSQIYSVWRSDI